MDLVFLLVITASRIFPAAVAAADDVAVVECPESEDGQAVYLPHPTDCRKFYGCQNHIPVLMECPPSLYFDPTINVCNYPELVDCKQPNSTTTTKSPTSSTTGLPVTTTTTDDIININSTTMEPIYNTTTAFPATTTTKSPTSTTTGLPVTTTTTDYIININSTTMKPIYNTIFEALETNTTHYVNHNQTTTTSEGRFNTTTLQPTYNTTTMDTTTEEPSFNTTTMEATTMEPTDNTTTTTTDTSPAIQCPESTDGYPVYVAHPTDCTKFYECHDEEPILMECAPPLYFDPRIDVCNYPELVDCKMP